MLMESNRSQGKGPTEADRQNSKKMRRAILSIARSIILAAALNILIAYPLRNPLEPFIGWLNAHGWSIDEISFVLAEIFNSIIEHYSPSLIDKKTAKKLAAPLTAVILFAIPFVWLSAILTGAISTIYPFIALMAFAAIIAWIFPLIPEGSSILKSLLFAVPPITLGVALGYCGPVFVGNIAEHGTPIPDATIVVVDHFNNPSWSGTYTVYAATYDVIRSGNQIKVSIQGTSCGKSINESRDAKISFNSKMIPPDGKKRSFTLAAGKRYGLNLM